MRHDTHTNHNFTFWFARITNFRNQDFKSWISEFGSQIHKRQFQDDFRQEITLAPDRHITGISKTHGSSSAKAHRHSQDRDTDNADEINFTEPRIPLFQTLADDRLDQLSQLSDSQTLDRTRLIYIPTGHTERATDPKLPQGTQPPVTPQTLAQHPSQQAPGNSVDTRCTDTSKLWEQTAQSAYQAGQEHRSQRIRHAHSSSSAHW